MNMIKIVFMCIIVSIPVNIKSDNPFIPSFLYSLKKYLAKYPDDPRLFFSNENYTNKVKAAVFNPTGDRILIAFLDGVMKLWDLDGNCLATFHGHTDAINSATFNPTNRKSYSHCLGRWHSKTLVLFFTLHLSPAILRIQYRSLLNSFSKTKNLVFIKQIRSF